MGGTAVLRLSETYSPGENMYFDRFFSSMGILGKLKEKGISRTGTAMTQRFPNAGLKTDRELIQQERGSYDSKVREGGDVLIMKWADNKCITMSLTCH